MPEYIEREVVVAELAKGTIVTDDIYGLGILAGLGHALNAVRAAPAADVAPVVHGRWIRRGNEKKCSVCGFIYYSNNDEWNGCPNCLAKMDGR